MKNSRHSINFRQAVYELFGIGQDLSHLLSEEDRSLAYEGQRVYAVAFDERLYRWAEAASTAQCTARIYAQFMPELKTVFAE